MDAADNLDVIIVGGGAAGLAASIQAAVAGRHVAVVGPVRSVPDRRTTALLAGSVELLTDLGVWAKLADKAQPLVHMRLIDDTNRLIRAPEANFRAQELRLDAFGYNIGNEDLLTALDYHAGASGVKRFDGTASNIEVRPDGARLQVGSQSLTSTLLVGADGRSSAVRSAADIPSRTTDYPQHALVVDLAHQFPHRGITTEFHTTSGPFTLVPIPGNNSALVCVARPSETAALVDLDPAQLALELEKRAHHILGKFNVLTAPQVFPLSTVLADRFTAPSCVLVGEAAHVVPPIGAQGFNMSLADVALLGRYLAEARWDQLDWLDQYNDARRQDARLRHLAVNMMNRSLLSGFLPGQVARSAGLYALNAVPKLRQSLMRRGMGLAR